jgi:hypothetical protein
MKHPITKRIIAVVLALTLTASYTTYRPKEVEASSLALSVALLPFTYFIGGIMMEVTKEMLDVYIAMCATMGIYYTTEDMALRALYRQLATTPSFYQDVLVRMATSTVVDYVNENDVPGTIRQALQVPVEAWRDGMWIIDNTFSSLFRSDNTADPGVTISSSHAPVQTGYYNGFPVFNTGRTLMTAHMTIPLTARQDQATRCECTRWLNFVLSDQISAYEVNKQELRSYIVGSGGSNEVLVEGGIVGERIVAGNVQTGISNSPNQASIPLNIYDADGVPFHPNIWGQLDLGHRIDRYNVGSEYFHIFYEYGQYQSNRSPGIHAMVLYVGTGACSANAQHPRLCRQ